MRISSIPFKYLSNTLYIRNSWLQVLFKKTPYPLRNGWPQLLSWNKETLYPTENRSVRLNAVTNKEKMFFRNSYFRAQPFLMSCYFTKIFVYLQYIISVVCYFSAYKLIGWDPANIYLFDVNSRNTRKRYEICPKLTINTIESCSGVIITQSLKTADALFHIIQNSSMFSQ